MYRLHADITGLSPELVSSVLLSPTEFESQNLWGALYQITINFKEGFKSRVFKKSVDESKSAGEAQCDIPKCERECKKKDP